MSQKFLQKRALAYTRRTLSGTSVHHLVVFLKYPDKISMLPFRPVWDVYYYTSRREGKAARAFPARKIKFAEFAFPRGPPFLEESTGGRGRRGVVGCGRHFSKIVKLNCQDFKKLFLLRCAWNIDLSSSRRLRRKFLSG